MICFDMGAEIALGPGFRPGWITEVAGPSRASDGAGPWGPAERRAARACHSAGEAHEQRAPRAASGGFADHQGEPALVAYDEGAAASVDRSSPTLGLRVYVGSSR